MKKLEDWCKNLERLSCTRQAANPRLQATIKLPALMASLPQSEGPSNAWTPSLVLSFPGILFPSHK